MRRVNQWFLRGKALGFEAASALLCSKFYALGMWGTPLPYVRPIRRSAVDQRVPVLFVHGVLHNPSAFLWLKQRLALAGWQRFDEIQLATTRDSIPVMATQLAERVRQLKIRTGAPQVDVIAHSLGGIVARYYVQLLDGDGHIRQLLTLGSPHQGTPWSRISPWAHLKDLHPQSALMKRLGSRPPPEFTQVVSVRGTRDIFLRRGDRGFWPGVRNLALQDLGHTGVLYSSRVVQILLGHLGPVAPPVVSPPLLPHREGRFSASL